MGAVDEVRLSAVSDPKLGKSVAARRARALALVPVDAVSLDLGTGLSESREALGRVKPASQDVVVIGDLVDPSQRELGELFSASRAALRPGGVLCFHTAEDLGIDSLRELLAEHFEALDAFSWNALERDGAAVVGGAWFAVAHAGRPYANAALELPQSRATSAGPTSWTRITLADGQTLPPVFLLRAEVHVREAPEDAIIHFLFTTTDPGRYFWTGARAASIRGKPVDLMLSAELLACVGDASWADVERIEMRVRSPSGGPFDVRVSDARVSMDAAVAGRRSLSGTRRVRPRLDLPRTTLTSKLFDPRDYQKPAFAEIRRYFDSWWYVLALEQVKFSYSSRNRAWEYGQLITSVPFEEKRVLDLGTSGSLAPIYLVRMLGCSVVTFDLHWEDERRLLYDATGIAGSVEIDIGNMDEPLPYEDDSFDIVTSWSVIEHLSDYSTAVSEVKRVCRDGGHILLTTDFATNGASSPKSGVLFDRPGLDKLVAEFDLPFVGDSDYDNVALEDPSNLAVKGEYTFASLVFQN